MTSGCLQVMAEDRVIFDSVEDIHVLDNVPFTSPESAVPQKCTAPKKDGFPCTAWAMRGQDKCPGHAGVIGGDTSKPKREGQVLGHGGTQVPLTDAAKARAALMSIVDKGRADPTTVSAAREILAQDGAATQAAPRTAVQIGRMRTDELIPLLRTLEHAHTLPEGEMMGQTEA